MQELTTEFQFQARFYKIGEINPSTRQVWFVLHGYAQLAKFFIQKFSSITKENICVIAPEGLSRFYLENIETRSKTGSSRVGATWMTRENRLMDIENYIRYLTAVYHSQLQGFSIPVTVLGFSQGAATASRWVMSQQIDFSRLILWAGIFPDDIDFENGRQTLNRKVVEFVYGSRDQFLTTERLQVMEQLASKMGVTSQPTIFDGGHQIDEATLMKFV